MKIVSSTIAGSVNQKPGLRWPAIIPGPATARRYFLSTPLISLVAASMAASGVAPPIRISCTCR